MYVPAPAPSKEEILIVAEAMLVSYGDAEAAIDGQPSQAVADAKWARTLDDIALWATAGTEAGDIKRVGDIEFFQGAAAAARLDLRNRLRQRYGFDVLINELGQSALAGMESLEWF